MEPEEPKKRKKISLKDTLRKVAPSIAGAIGGPIGKKAVEIVSEVVLGRSDATEEEIEQALVEADPAALLELRKADQAFRTGMAQMALEEERLHASDRANARAREVSLRDWFTKALGVVIVAGFFASIWILIYRAPPADSKDVVYLLIGSLTSSFAAVVGYYFGSSAGSKDKTELLSRGSQVEVHGSPVEVDVR